MGLHSLFIITGEPSGDLHASQLVEKLQQTAPQITLSGVPGPKLRSAGINGPLNMEDFRVMGFTDVIKALPKLYKQFYLLANHILHTQPSGVVFVDYPGFNLRLAKHLRKKGYKGKLIHYICPSVWAWGKKRIHTMASTLDLLLTIYPFEATYFSQTSLPVQFVGNPLCDYIATHTYRKEWRAQVSLPKDAVTIGLFPGSRAEEIKRNLPIMLETAKMFSLKHPGAYFAISCSTPQSKATIQEMVPLSDQIVYVPKEFTYELMQDCHCAIAKSGTVTLELALHRVPTVVIYKLTALNRFIAKHIVRVNLPLYCIVNILAKKEVFPELINREVTANELTHLLEVLFGHTQQRQHCIQACIELQRQLKPILEGSNTGLQGAKAILEMQ